MPKSKTRLEELRGKRQIQLDRTGFVVMGVVIVVGSLVAARLLTWLTNMVMGG